MLYLLYIPRQVYETRRLGMHLTGGILASIRYFAKMYIIKCDILLVKCPIFAQSV